ncbi:L-threonylcarbamoyladenylate synthase [Lactobacillus terrae]|uniref:L-threonylcarbamoyladenylate synthase n=1 Tax=Lactobacillus terrae TaxID=2269374 RepID=UPI000C1B68FC|nr:L-threonylcarbamoyladenylate synthase [Lactobacillus terrae]
MTEILTSSEIDKAVSLLDSGQLVSFPTETVYGLGADATNEDAVKNVYLAKGRPSDNPLIVHVSSPDMVFEYADENYSDQVRELMDNFWPGPLTIIFPIKRDRLSSSVTGGLDTAAFRMPDNQLTLSLIDKLGRPIVGPSANTSGKPSPTLAEHVYHDLNGKIAAILDDGPTVIGVESTVLDMSTDVPTILRPGMITVDDLGKYLPVVSSDHHKVGQKEIPKAPGMKYTHYSPNAEVIIVDNKDDFSMAMAEYSNDSVGIMATDDLLSNIKNADLTFSLGNDIYSATRNLYAGLRYLDNKKVKYILAQGFSDDNINEAYNNRLEKSAGQKHYKK